ncbi:nucleoside-diphosphate kinase [Pseudaminobacter arsenicus]|uniref:Nucleoside-diphosphate kinase n=1 Tax=Borborobacter arsenicus TaxID=1851146 RepID=A0A432V8A6_9HYPH|nr:nucleoside-diphosphate kinase [Pseudaminobacter arsenicus]RUM98389.1 nucleoside-diphosphate kinase [Pseudaminobacter arsenicus]
MSDKPHCLLTSKDFAILETMRERMDTGDAALAALLRRKLESARVVFRDEIPAGVVTLNSRVAYSIDGQPAGTHLLVQGGSEDLPEGVISISTARGLGLLGLSEGQSIAVEHPGKGGETLLVEQVTFQPEADLHRRECMPTMGSVVSGAGATAQVVSLHAFRRAQPQAAFDGPEDDDPGPQAA